MNKNLRERHYKRIKSFLTYDIEERDLQEQRIILEEIQNVVKDMLEDISVRRIRIHGDSILVVGKNGVRIEGGAVSFGDVFKTILNVWFSSTEKDKKAFSKALAGGKDCSYLEAILNSTRKSGLNIGESLKNISKTLEKEKFYIELYYREGKEPASIGIFNKDKLWIITNIHDVDEIIKFIENDIPCEKDDSIFYVDVNGFGISIYDTLKENDYDVRELECKILNN